MSDHHDGIAEISPATSIWPDSLMDGGEMGARIRALDWSSTRAGPIERWPQSLRATVTILLGSRYPMILLWGDDLLQIYNDAYIGLIGDKHPHALGRSIRETQAESWDVIGPMIRDVMTTGIPNWVPAQMLPLERAGYREESYFSLSYSAVKNDDGVINGMLCVCSEVTEQVIGERRLKLQRDLAAKAGETRSTEATCRDIAAAVAEYGSDVPFALIYLLEPGSTMLKLHGAVGLAPGGVLSPAAVTPETAAACPLPVLEAAKGETVALENVGALAPVAGGPWGEPVKAAVAMPIASGGSSAPLGALVLGVSPNRALDDAYRAFHLLLAGQVSVAIRNAKAYEEERKRADVLAELDRAKTAFFSNVSHEFRTPLTLMLGPLEEFLRGTSDAISVRREDMEGVYRNSLRLLRLVNSLLDFSRVEAGRAQARFQKTDLAALTRDLASSFESLMSRAGLDFRIRVSPLSQPPYVDHDMWEKIVLNLLSNAYKFTLSGSISVNLSEIDGQAVLSVKDTGSGIPQAELPHLFERFHRVTQPKARSFEGSGIGLALVRELILLHGGEIEVESEPGSGSRFTVKLPLDGSHIPPERIAEPSITAARHDMTKAFVEEAGKWGTVTSGATEPDAAEPVAAAGPDGSVILLADDNADMRDYIAKLIGAQHAVISVADGAEAWTVLSGKLPDLVITDVMMPNVDGFELLRRIRGTTRTQTLPVIMVSARAGEEAKYDGLTAAADDYLIKPFSALELRARISTQLRLARLRKEAADALQHAAKMETVGQLSGGVAHDFNNLLTVILGNLEALSRRGLGNQDPRAERSLANAIKGANRAATLTQRLLAFARRQPLSPKPIALNRLIVNLTDLIRQALGETVRLEIVTGAGLWDVEADPVQLENALLNLVFNSKDAMPEGGQLTVEVANAFIDENYAAAQIEVAPGQYVVIAVTDTGHGMAPEVLPRSIEPFFTTKGTGQGTGLGLSQVYGFVKQSGGHVKIYSEAGQGTCVKLYLPRLMSGAAEEPEPAARQIARGIGKEVILVVEDDSDVRNYTTDMLRELGYTVQEAADGVEALALLKQMPKAPDLLFTDVVLPGMNGRQLADKAREVFPRLKVLYTSGYTRNAVVHGGRLDSGVDLIMKPFSYSSLAERIRTILDRN